MDYGNVNLDYVYPWHVKKSPSLKRDFLGNGFAEFPLPWGSLLNVRISRMPLHPPKGHGGRVVCPLVILILFFKKKVAESECSRKKLCDMWVKNKHHSFAQIYWTSALHQFPSPQKICIDIAAL